MRTAIINGADVEVCRLLQKALQSVGFEETATNAGENLDHKTAFIVNSKHMTYLSVSLAYINHYADLVLTADTVIENPTILDGARPKMLEGYRLVTQDEADNCIKPTHYYFASDITTGGRWKPNDLKYPRCDKWLSGLSYIIRDNEELKLNKKELRAPEGYRVVTESEIKNCIKPEHYYYVNTTINGCAWECSGRPHSYSSKWIEGNTYAVKNERKLVSKVNDSPTLSEVLKIVRRTNKTLVEELEYAFRGGGQ